MRAFALAATLLIAGKAAAESASDQPSEPNRRVVAEFAVAEGLTLAGVGLAFGGCALTASPLTGCSADWGVLGALSVLLLPSLSLWAVSLKTGARGSIPVATLGSFLGSAASIVPAVLILSHGELAANRSMTAAVIMLLTLLPVTGGVLGYELSIPKQTVQLYAAPGALYARF